MENANSLRRVTRSQSRTPSGAQVKPVPATPASLKKATPATARKSRKALADVTNDSPVAGLTPLLGTSQGGVDLTPKCQQLCQAPESSRGTPGDEVLRAYCITMLQQSGGNNVKALRAVPSLLSQFTDSPTMLAAPTPANTPANVWPEGGGFGSGPTLSESGMESPASSEDEYPLVIVLNTQNPSLKDTWSSVPLCSLTSSPAKEDVPKNAIVPLLVAEPILPVSDPPRLLVVDAGVVATDTTPRALDFDSPEKDSSQSSLQVYSRRIRNLAAEKALADQIQSTPSGKTDLGGLEDDSWSVEVNMNSPPAENLPTETTDDLSSYNQLECDLTDSDGVATAPEVGGDVEELELVSTPLENTHFVKFRFKKEGDGQGKVDRLGTPFLWDQRESTTEGHFVEFDNEDECDEDEWADCEEDYDEEEDCDDFDEIDCCDELCRGISHISMGGDNLKGLPAFAGTHTRFHYDSDGQIDEEVVSAAPGVADVVSPGVTRLKGLPTPQGRHLRFETLSD